MGLSRGSGLSNNSGLYGGFRGLSASGGLSPSAWTPASLGASLYAWWDAQRTDLITASGGLVSSWRDSVAAYDATQAVGSARPTLGATSFNGTQGITTDGTDDELTCTSSALLAQLGGATSYELWGVVDQTALVADATQRITLSVGNANATTRRTGRLVSGGVNRAIASTGNGSAVTTVTNTSVDFSGRHVLRAISTATETSIEVDGVTMTPSAVVPSTTATRVRLGAGANIAAGTFWQGVFSSLLFTAPLTASQATLMFAWGATRTGT